MDWAGDLHTNPVSWHFVRRGGTLCGAELRDYELRTSRNCPGQMCRDCVQVMAQIRDAIVREQQKWSAYKPVGAAEVKPKEEYL